MRTTLTWAICAALLGSVAGVVLGYWGARPWTIGAASPPSMKVEASQGKSPAAPTAEIAETTFNFDKMESGTTQRHEFPIKNTGDAPLSLEFVSHTCKCTTVELNGKSVEPGAATVVPPGEEAVVLLEWVAAAAGPFRHGASFKTNDASHERLELQVEGEVVESSTLYPSQLDFGGVRVGQPATATMFVTATLDPDVQILSHEVTDAKLAERVSVTVEPAKAGELPPSAKAGAKIVATYNPGGAIGPFGGSLELTTNLKSAPNLKVPIYGAVRGDISILPTKGWTEANGMLRMAPATTAAGASTRLFVVVRGEHAQTTKLSVARVEPPELKATLGELNKISDNIVQAPLTVEIPPGTRPMVRAGEDQGGEGEIILATTHPDTPEVRLRVTFTVKP